MVEIATLLGAKSIGITSEIRRTIDFAQQLQEVIQWVFGKNRSYYTLTFLDCRKIHVQHHGWI